MPTSSDKSRLVVPERFLLRLGLPSIRSMDHWTMFLTPLSPPDTTTCCERLLLPQVDAADQFQHTTPDTQTPGFPDFGLSSTPWLSGTIIALTSG